MIASCEPETALFQRFLSYAVKSEACPPCLILARRVQYGEVFNLDHSPQRIGPRVPLLPLTLVWPL
jgi:hypothetical protein